MARRLLVTCCLCGLSGKSARSTGSGTRARTHRARTLVQHRKQWAVEQQPRHGQALLFSTGQRLRPGLHCVPAGPAPEEVVKLHRCQAARQLWERARRGTGVNGGRERRKTRAASAVAWIRLLPCAHLRTKPHQPLIRAPSSSPGVTRGGSAPVSAMYSTRSRAPVTAQTPAGGNGYSSWSRSVPATRYGRWLR